MLTNGMLATAVSFNWRLGSEVINSSIKIRNVYVSLSHIFYHNFVNILFF